MPWSIAPGFFTTIAVIGVLCALLGRMLGDVGPYVPILVGLVLLLVAVDMLWGATALRPAGCPRGSMSGA